MRITINVPYRLRGGGLVHLRHLLGAWARTGIDRDHAVSLITRADNVGILGESLSDRIELHVVGRHFFSTLVRVGWEQAALPWMVRRQNPDVLFCPGNLIPLWSPVPTVVVLQNAAPFCASTRLDSMGVSTWAWFKLLGAFMRASAEKASRVIFLSHYLREQFVKRFKFPGERGDVVYHGRDGLQIEKPDHRFSGKLGFGSPYILSVSHLYPYKNIPALIQGYFLSRRSLQGQGLKLVLVGKAAARAHLAQISSMIRQYCLEDWVLLAGDVPYPAIGELLAGCEWFVFQSTCENCPNTLIEALSAGVPITCSNASVMPEIAGDAALYFDPFDATDIARALTRMAEEPLLRADLRMRSLREVRRFPTWDEAGQMTLKSLEYAANQA